MLGCDVVHGVCDGLLIAFACLLAFVVTLFFWFGLVWCFVQEQQPLWAFDRAQRGAVWCGGRRRLR